MLSTPGVVRARRGKLGVEQSLGQDGVARRGFGRDEQAALWSGTPQRKMKNRKGAQ